MSIRSSVATRWLAVVMVPYVVLLGLPSAVRAQVLGPTDMPRPSGPTFPMQVGLPSDADVVQAERSVVNPAVLSPIALDGPIDPARYVCGRGDVFELNFWGRQNFRVRFSVDLEGRAFISKVGYVDITGKTLRQARTLVKDAVGRYFPGLNFDLTLVEPRTFLVHVVDNIPRPGAYSARAVDRASTVIAQAGGITGNASQRRITIQHRNGGTTRVDLLLYNLTGDIRYNPYLSDGDVIDIPFEEVGVTVSGAVKRPGHFELIQGKDLAELLELSGGLATTATRQLPIRLIRKNKLEREAKTEIPYPQSGLPQLDLRPDDVLQVPSVAELQQTVLLIGAIAGAVAADEATHVRRLPFVEKDTVRTLLERAGGVTAGADLAQAYILRSDSQQVSVDLDALLVRRDFSADKPIEMGDSLVVPYKRRSVVVEGAVFRPNAYPFNPKFSVLDYVAAAGGDTRFAQPLDNVKLIRPTGEILHLSSDLKASPGDTIVVPERNFSRSETVQLVLGAVGLLLSGAALYVAAKR